MKCFKMFALVSALMLSAGCYGSKDTVPSVTADMGIASPDAQFVKIVVLAPVPKGKDEDTGVAKYVLIQTAGGRPSAHMIPPAFIPAFSALNLGSVITTSPKLIATWDRVDKVLGEPAEQALLRGCNPAVAPRADGLRKMDVAAGPLTTDETVAYIGRLVTIQVNGQIVIPEYGDPVSAGPVVTYDPATPEPAPFQASPVVPDLRPAPAAKVEPAAKPQPKPQVNKVAEPTKA